ncbi:MAG: hypothetical protein OQK00_04400, partial [Rhodobacteraceae bacterium]|nr:hypothetical protein [Paracoccaceae bacterium]
MRVDQTNLPGVLLITPRRFGDPYKRVQTSQRVVHQKGDAQAFVLTGGGHHLLRGQMLQQVTGRVHILHQGGGNATWAVEIAPHSADLQEFA